MADSKPQTGTDRAAKARAVLAAKRARDKQIKAGTVPPTVPATDSGHNIEPAPYERKPRGGSSTVEPRDVTPKDAGSNPAPPSPPKDETPPPVVGLDAPPAPTTPQPRRTPGQYLKDAFGL